MSPSRSSYGNAAGRASIPGPNYPDSGRIAGRARIPADYDRGLPPRSVSGGGRGPRGPYGPDGPGGLGPPPGGRRGRVRPRWGRIGLIAGVVVLVLGLLGAGGVWAYVNGLDNNVDRTDAFSDLTGGRPAKTVDGALNILMVGSDSRDPDAQVDQASDWRADTIIMMHIPASHDQAYLVSIPRDLYVRVPENAGAPCDSGQRAKVNAAFAFGGLPLAVRTVECFSDVRIDNVVAVDFGGFQEVTDALGGVDLYIERQIKSIHKPYRTFKKGKMHLTGAQALDYIRQRKQFPDGDFARMRHQQEFLKALMDKAVSTGTLANPGKLNAFLQSVTNAVTVDENLSLVDMALQFRNLRSDNLRFITSPNAGSQTINGESVVVSDREKAIALYKAMADDTMDEWLGANATPSPTPGR
ncbi:LCP family protein [Actinomycetes bacterium KLBMP 9797]